MCNFFITLANMGCCNHALHIMLEMNILDDIICIQEPWWGHIGTQRLDGEMWGMDVQGGTAVTIGPPFLYFTLLSHDLSCDHHVITYVTYCSCEVYCSVMLLCHGRCYEWTPISLYFLSCNMSCDVTKGPPFLFYLLRFRYLLVM